VREQGSAAAGERAAALPRRCLRKRRGEEGELHEARDLGGGCCHRGGGGGGDSGESFEDRRRAAAEAPAAAVGIIFA
jgi:hypothetical protein